MKQLALFLMSFLAITNAPLQAEDIAPNQIYCGESKKTTLIFSREMCSMAPFEFDTLIPRDDVTDPEARRRHCQSAAQDGWIDIDDFNKCERKCEERFQEFTLQAYNFTCVKPRNFPCPSEYICPKSVGGIGVWQNQCDTIIIAESSDTWQPAENGMSKIHCSIRFRQAFQVNGPATRSCGTCAAQ